MCKSLCPLVTKFTQETAYNRQNSRVNCVREKDSCCHSSLLSILSLLKTGKDFDERQLKLQYCHLLLSNKNYNLRLTLSVVRGAETRGDGGIYSPNNLTLYPPIIWVWPSSLSPSIIWLWCASEHRSPHEFAEQKLFYFWWSVPALVKTFFWSSLNLLTWKKIVVEVHPPQCWK